MKLHLPSLSKCILLLLCLIQVGRALAQTPDSEGIIYVKPAGTGDGSSWDNATGNLHQAIHADGVSKVFVAIGRYNANLQSFVMKNNVEIYGGFNPAAGIIDLDDARILPRTPKSTGGSILDGRSANRVISNEFGPGNPMDNTAVLDGFTVANGDSDKGGGMLNVYASPTLRNILFLDNTSMDIEPGIYSEGGGAMLNKFSSPVISYSIFSRNFARDGSAIKNANAGPYPMVLTNVVIAGNETGVDYFNGKPSGTITSAMDIVLKNVTMADNIFFPIVQFAGTATIHNSIVLGSIIKAGGDYTAENSIVGSNIAVTALFSGTVSDYALRPCSPAINAGNNALYTGPNAGDTDLAGNPRTVHGTIDLGAYESNTSVCSPDASGIIYVKTAASGNGTGDSWANATDNLRGAVHLNGVQQVWVQKGTYDFNSGMIYGPKDGLLSRNGHLTLKNNVAIFGGFDPENGISDLSHERIMPNPQQWQGSIIHGGTFSPCVMTFQDASTRVDHTAVLDGFSLTEGRGWTNTDGAAISNVFASPTLRNLLMTDNKGVYGAGVYNYQSSPAMTNIIIQFNRAAHGGGVCNDGLSAPIMTNVKITNNQAGNDRVGGYGGGVFNRNSSPTMNDVTIRGNTASRNGGGVYNDALSAPVMTNVTITGNESGYQLFHSDPAEGHGAGVYNRNSSPTLNNVIISGNTASRIGGGIYNDALSAPILTNLKITDNKARTGGGVGNRNSSPEFRNTVITGNIASIGSGGMSSIQSSSPKLVNATMAGNTPDAFTSDNSTVRLSNSIVFGATSGSAYTAEYSLIENNTSTANGNVDATGIGSNDVFTDAANGDFTVKAGAVSVNRGSNLLYPGLDENTKDLAGNGRVYDFATGGVIDLGAYEKALNVVIPDANGIVYVKTTVAGTGTGSDWANATNRVQEAIDAANAEKVFVAIGNYDIPSPHSFVMKNNVAVYGGFDPDNGIAGLADDRLLPNHGASQGSVLNGKNERPVIWNSNNGLTNNAILDGFTITRGYSSVHSGGGIVNNQVSPTLRNLVVSGNGSILGGAGIFNYNSSPVISDVIIRENTSENGDGGGMATLGTSSPVLSNVQITGNTAPAGAGVSFYMSSGNATLTNVTIAGNLGNGMMISSGAVNLINSIIYGGVTGTYTAQYSLIEGNAATTNGNLNATGITLADLFADHTHGNFTLAACSPATNAGAPDAPDLPLLDLAGHSRIVAGRVDIGAYENTHSAGDPGIAALPGATSMMQTANGTTAYYNSCNEVLASVVTTGAAGSIEGMTIARVWIDHTAPRQYVRRHYEITPEQNAATASGRITLYFTQTDFDAFNALNPTLQLPSGPSGNVANVLIEKRGGSSTDGTGQPSTYPGTAETISEVEVVWNSVAERWEVSFNTTGFSGFFVKTSSEPLPVKWISFTAHLNDDKQGVLEWKVDQSQVAGYQIERSSNARDFRMIGSIPATSDGIAQYSFVDPVPFAGTFYYRIRQTDHDGTFAYSRIVSLRGQEAALLTAFPNPAQEKVKVRIGAQYIGTQLRLTNIAGVQLQQLTVRDENLEVNLDKYPAGVYILYTFDGYTLRLIRN